MKCIATLLISTTLLAGCILVPTPPHGLGMVYDKDSVASMRPGETTRADVLLTLGEPKYRLEDDGFFMYEWSVAYVWLFTIITQQPFIPIGFPHYLCLEFGADSRITSCNELTGSIDKAILKCTKHLEKSE